MPTPVPALPTLSGPYPNTPWPTDAAGWCDACGNETNGTYWQGGDGSVFCRDCVDKKRGYEEL